MSLVFIHIKDIKSSKEYILNSNPILKSDLDKKFINIYMTFKASNPNLKLSKLDDCCELYQYTSVVNKGWVWNENVSTKDILYSISAIPLLNPNQSTSTTSTLTSTATQTSTVIDQKSIGNILCEVKTDHVATLQKLENEDVKCALSNNLYKTSSILNYGYSNNFLFPSLQGVLVDELKKKLTQPNYGLQSNHK